MKQYSVTFWHNEIKRHVFWDETSMENVLHDLSIHYPNSEVISIILIQTNAK